MGNAQNFTNTGILAVVKQLKQLNQRNLWKKFWGFNGIRTHDLCDTGAMLYQLSYEASLEAGWSLGFFSVLSLQLRGSISLGYSLSLSLHTHIHILFISYTHDFRNSVVIILRCNTTRKTSPSCTLQLRLVKPLSPTPDPDTPGVTLVN